MKYIIMCGGSYKKWETPRQLIEIQGEPIVARTIRLLREAGANDIAISTNGSDFAQFGVPILTHGNDFVVRKDGIDGAWVHAFYPADEPACYLMGDVVFSPEAIQKIVEAETDGILFFASTPPFSPLFRKRWAEPFAFKVVDQKRFRAAIRFVAANVHTGIFWRHPISWELWQVIIGHNVRDIDYDTVTAINDYTCDVDSPEDAETIERILCSL